MLSINDINLLQAQNEGYRKQNEELQKENKYLKDLYNQALKDYEEALDLSKQKSWEIGNLGYKIHNQRKEINQRLKQIEVLKKECEKYEQALDEIEHFITGDFCCYCTTELECAECMERKLLDIISKTKDNNNE